MTFRSTLLVATAALLAASSASWAQDKDTPAKLMLALQQALPRKSSQPGTQVPFSHSIDWNATIDNLGEILTRSHETPVEPHALFAMGNAHFAAGRIEEALALFEDLKQRFQDHPLVAVKFDPETPKTLVDLAINDCADQLTFRSKNTIKVLEKPIIDKKLLVTLHFTEGPVKIRFYENVAPKHRENFLKLAREGFYDRTRVHRVVAGTAIHLGDPNTRDGLMEDWGRGGPGYSLPQEHSLATHKAGAVSAMRSNVRSHGSQFQIILQEQTYNDAIQTVFAEVVEGLDIVERISRQSRTQHDAPTKEVFLNGITVEEK